MIWAVQKIVDAVSYEQYSETGCPECGTKENYIVVRMPGMVMVKCSNPECAIAFPVTFEEVVR